MSVCIQTRLKITFQTDAAQIFGFKYTLHRFETGQGTNHYARLLGRTLQVNGMANLPKLFPYMTKMAADRLQEHVMRGKPCQGMYISGALCIKRTVEI